MSYPGYHSIKIPMSKEGPFPSKTPFLQPPYPGMVGPIHTCSLVFSPKVIGKKIHFLLAKFSVVQNSSHTNHLELGLEDDKRHEKQTFSGLLLLCIFLFFEAFPFEL